MIPNALVKLPPEKLLDHLTEWAYRAFANRLPVHQADLCEYAPYVAIQGKKSFKCEAGKSLTQYEDFDPDDYYEYEVDPDWKGEQIDRDTLRAKNASGAWVDAEIRLRLDNVINGPEYFAEFFVEKGQSFIVVSANYWAIVERDEADWNPRFGAERGTKSTILNHLRAIFAHEITHWLDPHGAPEQDSPSYADPDSVVLPWEQKAWQEAYVSDPREREAMKREAFERLKAAWRDSGEDAPGAAFPIHLWRQVLEEAPNVELMFKLMPARERSRAMSDIQSAFKLFSRRQVRRSSLGRT